MSSNKHNLDLEGVVQDFLIKYQETGVIHSEELLFFYDTLVKSGDEGELKRFNDFAALVAGEYYRKKIQQQDILRTKYYELIGEDVFIGEVHAPNQI